MAAAPIYIGTIKSQSQTFVNADGVATKAIFTAGASGAKVQLAEATSDDTAARILRLSVQVGGAGADIQIGSVSIAITAGIGGLASVNLLSATQLPWILEDGSMLLGPSDVLKANAEVAVTAAKTIWVLCAGGSY